MNRTRDHLIYYENHMKYIEQDWTRSHRQRILFSSFCSCIAAMHNTLTIAYVCLLCMWCCLPKSTTNLVVLFTWLPVTTTIRVHRCLCSTSHSKSFIVCGVFLVFAIFLITHIFSFNCWSFSRFSSALDSHSFKIHANVAIIMIHGQHRVVAFVCFGLVWFRISLFKCEAYG